MTVVRRRSAETRGIVLGIDASYTNLAICGLTYDASRAYEYVGHFGSTKAGQGVDRLIEIEAWLHGMFAIMEMFPIRHICLEGYAPSRKFGREMAGELGAVVKMALRGLGDPVGYPTIVGTTAVKKFATGKGVGDKNVMLKAVYQRWGYDTNSDDCADAYTLARVAHALQWPQADLPKFQQEVLGALTRHTERADDDTGSERASG